MSTTKILHVISRMNLGGTARYVSNLVVNIPNSALATGFVQGAEIEDPAACKLQIYRVPHMGRKIAPLTDFKAWFELRKVIKEINPDIVHTHTFKAGLIGRLVGGTHKRVHTFHGHLFDDHSFSTFEKWVITCAERFLANRTDVLVSVGKRVGLELRAEGIGTNRIWISIPPGVMKLPKIEKSVARKILSLDQNEFLVGWMGRMTGVKNPLLMLEVARHLPGIQFIMAGGGDLLEEVRRSAPANVSVIGWVDASTFWSALDCAISTSDNEGMPIALIEAQLAGLPVVATDVGSNSEVIEDGITGLITQKNCAALEEALLKIISDRDTYEEMVNESACRAASRFSPDNMLAAHLRLYAKLDCFHLGS